MHTVKGKKVTVIHLPRAQQSEGRPAFLLRATPSWPRAQEKAGTEHSALGQLHPDLWHLGAPGHQPGPKWQGRGCLDPSHRYQSQEEKATGSVWQCKRGEGDATPLGASEPARAPDRLHAGAGAARKSCLWGLPASRPAGPRSHRAGPGCHGVLCSSPWVVPSPTRAWGYVHWARPGGKGDTRHVQEPTRRFVAGPCPHQAAQAPACSLSSARTQHAPRASRRVRLCGPGPRPCPGRTVPPSRGQVNNCCCFGTRRSQ